MHKNVLIIDHQATPKREAIAEFLDRNTSDFGIFTAIDTYSGFNTLVCQGIDAFTHIFLCVDLPDHGAMRIAQFLANHAEKMPLINLYGEDTHIMKLVAETLAEYQPLVLDDISPLIERVEPPLALDHDTMNDLIVEVTCENGEYFLINLSTHTVIHTTPGALGSPVIPIADTNAASACLGERLTFFAITELGAVESKTPISSLIRYRFGQRYGR